MKFINVLTYTANRELSKELDKMKRDQSPMMKEGIFFGGKKKITDKSEKKRAKKLFKAINEKLIKIHKKVGNVPEEQILKEFTIVLRNLKELSVSDRSIFVRRTALDMLQYIIRVSRESGGSLANYIIGKL